MGLRKTLLPLSLLTFAALAIGLTSADEVQGKKLLPTSANAHQDMMLEQAVVDGFGGGFGMAVAEFRLEGMPLGGTKAPSLAPHEGSHGGTVVVDDEGVLTIDRDSGKLLRVERGGETLASLDFRPGAGQLVRDARSGAVYLAARHDHRVVRVDASGDTLEIRDRARLREPYGLALSPDGATLYVTTVADAELVALDTETMRPRWRIDLASEPRGLAVSPDGSRALVSFLSTGVVGNVELGANAGSVSYVTLDPGQAVGADTPLAFEGEFGAPQLAQQAASTQRPGAGTPSLSDTKDRGRRFARNAHSVGFVGDGIAIVPHQLSTPHIPSTGFENEGTYGGGGGFMAPITHRVAMIDAEDAFMPELAFAEIGLHQPRALAYDAASDTLYLAGYGNDQLMAIAEVSQNTVHMGWTVALSSTTGACGPDGVAVDGDRLWVHCELGRNLIEVVPSQTSAGATMVPLAELASSSRTPAAQRGAELFRRGFDPRLSVGGFMACASCHPEARTDGLSWRIESHNLQTPLLAGRVLGTHPFKWDGQDEDLQTSLTNTVGRLGGSGLTPAEVGDLQAFLESVPQPLPPALDADAIERGKALFESEEAACTACHDGARFADGSQHDLDTNIGEVDTPSLIGLAHSAPYYHDGSAQTLRALLTDRGSVHDMGETAHLTDAEIDDLIAYLESL